jgi:hypothetical protein
LGGQTSGTLCAIGWQNLLKNKEKMYKKSYKKGVFTISYERAIIKNGGK